MHLLSAVGRLWIALCGAIVSLSPSRIITPQIF